MKRHCGAWSKSARLAKLWPELIVAPEERVMVVEVPDQVECLESGERSGGEPRRLDLLMEHLTDLHSDCDRHGRHLARRCGRAGPRRARRTALWRSKSPMTARGPACGSGGRCPIGPRRSQKALLGEPPSPATRPTGCEFRPRCPCSGSLPPATRKRGCGPAWYALPETVVRIARVRVASAAKGYLPSVSR